MAKLYFKYGAMGSSKTAQALITKYNYEENDMKVWLLKPSADTRDGVNILRSRIGLQAEVEIASPEVMILDEATANIDTETEILIQDSLEKMKNIGTMLIVAHRLSTIQHADNIILLSGGEIIEQGNHQQLLHQKGRYYQLYTLQYHQQQLKNS